MFFFSGTASWETSTKTMAVIIITLVINVSQKGLKSVIIIREYTICGELFTVTDYKLTYKLCSGLPVPYFNST